MTRSRSQAREAAASARAAGEGRASARVRSFDCTMLLATLPPRQNDSPDDLKDAEARAQEPIPHRERSEDGTGAEQEKAVAHAADQGHGDGAAAHQRGAVQ